MHAKLQDLGNASALEVELRCIGEGPVISVTPVKLAWGPCQVLIPVFKKVMLSNESLIPAEFECAFVSHCACLAVIIITVPFDRPTKDSLRTSPG